jgi:hypothetical protein
MVTSTPILGTVETRNIKLGAGRFFRGIAGATFAGTSKFDTANPGSSFEDLGECAADANVSATQSPFIFRNGVPSTRKKGFVIGREAQINLNFNEWKSRIMQTAIGLTAPINKLAAQEYVVQASPAPTNTIFTFDTVTGLAVNDEIVLGATTGALPASPAKGLISAIDTLQVTLRQAIPSALLTVASGYKAKEVISTKLPFGGSDVDTFPALYVIDFIGGAQVVWFFPQVASMGNFGPGMGSGTQNAQIPITFDAYGVYDSDLADNVVCIPFNFEV